MNKNLEKLIGQVRIANQQRFGRHTETMEAISGQLSLFNEAEALSEEIVREPETEEVLPVIQKRKSSVGSVMWTPRIPGRKNPSQCFTEKLCELYSEGNYKRMPDETCKRLRYEPASYTVKIHTVEVYVGTDGLHQDEFIRGNRPKDLLRNSIVTPSLEAAILSAGLRPNERRIVPLSCHTV